VAVTVPVTDPATLVAVITTTHLEPVRPVNVAVPVLVDAGVTADPLIVNVLVTALPDPVPTPPDHVTVNPVVVTADVSKLVMAVGGEGGAGEGDGCSTVPDVAISDDGVGAGFKSPTSISMDNWKFFKMSSTSCEFQPEAYMDCSKLYGRSVLPFAEGTAADGTGFVVGGLAMKTVGSVAPVIPPRASLRFWSPRKPRCSGCFVVLLYV